MTRAVSEAVIEEGCRRLRPILMTAFATIFALLPLALGLTGEGGFISKPLAVVVIGGLGSSTLLTLVLVPALYTMVEGRRERRDLRELAMVAGPAALASSPAEKETQRDEYVPAHALFRPEGDHYYNGDELDRSPWPLHLPSMDTQYPQSTMDEQLAHVPRAWFEDSDQGMDRMESPVDRPLQPAPKSGAPTADPW